MIDAGPMMPEARDALGKGVSDLGYRLADISQVIITHAHFDHFGLARWVVECSGATVMSHCRNRWMSSFRSEWDRRFTLLEQVFAEAGVPPALLEGWFAAGRSITQYGDDVSIDVEVGDGDVVEIGDRGWQILYTPGHAAGAICLYQPDQRILFSGDYLLADITSNPVLEPPSEGETERPRSLVDYLASMRRLRSLDVSLVLPAHGQPVADHQAALDSLHQHHAERSARLEEILSAPLTAYEACHELFPRLHVSELFLGLSETLGHLDVLLEEGRIRKVPDAVTRYVADHKGAS